MTNPIIELHGVTYSYPGRGTVLDQLDFSLNAGEKIGIMGPNGAGKTTFLHAAMGLVRPQEGEIRLFGRRMDAETDFREARLKLGFVFQHADDQLFSPTVLEDVAFGPLNQGLDPDEARQVARDTLDKLGLAGFEDRVPYRLSGGEQKLVALATAMAMRPRALLLDEPTTALDQDTKARLTDILQGLDIAVLAVSHEHDFLAEITDRILGFRHGRILADGLHVHTHTHVHTHGDLDHSHD